MSEPQQTPPDTEPSVPTVTDSQPTEPPATVPTETSSPETQPLVTEGTEPNETEPVETQPKPTDPPETEPPATEPPHTHNYTATSTVSPTCTKDGYTTYTCSCGDSYTGDTVKATGHSWGEWATTKEPTTEAEGEQTRKCSACGATETRAVEKLPEPEVEINLDYQAAIDYGNQYAVSTYGWIIDPELNMNSPVVGFYPGNSASAEWIMLKGGQDYLYAMVKREVDATYDKLAVFGDTTGAYVNCQVYEGADGDIWVYICYG